MDKFVKGDLVPSSFDTGIVAASYFASLCGCLLTVELLHRRGTALKSWRSWYAIPCLFQGISNALLGVRLLHVLLPWA